MMIIAIILSLLIVGAICTLLLFLLFSMKQKKISSQVTEMMEDIDKRKKEIGDLEQKLTAALSYLSTMQPLDLALDLEEKIKNLKIENENENLNLTAIEQKQKVIEQELQNAKPIRKNITPLSENTSIQNATEVSDSEIAFLPLAEELAKLAKKVETSDLADREILDQAAITLNKFQGHLGSLIETYNTANKRVIGLNAQYQELQQEYKKLQAKLEEDKI